MDKTGYQLITDSTDWGRMQGNKLLQYVSFFKSSSSRCKSCQVFVAANNKTKCAHMLCF